ncbi:hypothetical protein [Pseudomonas serbica]|uniref:hypothetical protein n=1 Tax=Pseudomonas serbica TaxID=2965074 RepID=UPI00237A685B|nr:hypothetical protein [Pseudomonas serbica]
MSNQIARDLTQAAQALIRTVNGTNPGEDVLHQQLWDLANACHLAKQNDSLNLLARAHQAVKETTRGFMNLVTRRGCPDVIAQYLELFPLHEQYAEEFLQIIHESECLNAADKSRLLGDLVDNVIKHETFTVKNQFGGTDFYDARKFLVMNLNGFEFEEGKSLDSTPLGKFCTNLCEIRNDAAAIIITTLNTAESARSSNAAVGYKALGYWFNGHQPDLFLGVMRNNPSDYNTFNIVQTTRDTLEAPYLAACLNMRSTDPDFQILIEGLKTYELRVDETFKRTMAYDSDGESMRTLSEGTLETLIAYSLTVEHVLPHAIQTVGTKYDLITALVNAGREVAKPEYQAFDSKARAQEVVDFVMDRVTGKEDFDLVKNSWLLPYAQKNLTFLKHAFGRDLGL